MTYFYKPKHLQFALWLRGWLRRYSQNPKNYQRGTIRGYFSAIVETLLDLRHQETFSKTIPNRYAQRDRKLVEGYHVPIEKDGN